MAASDLPVVTGASGHHFELEDGRKIFDACGGAAVACIGYGHESVSKAISEQASRVPYVPWAFFDNVVAKDLREFLLKTTDNYMKDCYIMSSGSEAVEAAAKLAREFHTITSSPQRTKYIARNTSYHGCTLGALALSGYESRRAPYEPLLSAETERLPAFNPYRQMEDGETAEVFVRRKLAELDDTFIRAGPETIAAVIMEPVVGAAMGCVSGWPGYLHGVRAMCNKYGALLIFDEVMCGMGRTGTMHAWQNPELVGDTPVVPDLQTIGKGLAGGYAPASALLVGEKIFEGMRGRVFTHGHTYQDHPVVCAAARAVQRIVEEENLLANVRSLGPLLGSLLKKNLESSPYIGDIRGVGMFWGIEIVQNKVGKTPFERNKAISKKIHQLAISDRHNLMIYYGQGCAGSSIGDHLMICPAYNVSEEQIRWIADTVAKVIHTFFERAEKSKCSDGSRQDINIVN